MGAEAGKQERETQEQPADPRAAVRALVDRYREGQSATGAAAKARADERRALWALAKVHAAARAAAARLQQAKIKKVGNIDELEKSAVAAVEKVCRLTPQYDILKEAAEQLGHCRNEPHPDAREEVLKKIPCGQLFIPSKDSAQTSPETYSPAEQEWDKKWESIAHYMAHSARLRQAQQDEVAGRERVLDANCIGMLRILQEFRRGKEELEEQTMMTKHATAPPPRPVCAFRRPW
eukprot:TRINITY_DN24235_c0_g1_i1.p1 TRINITY_DN24235_c0_g1~~TRINITY_DN24235_c0_g1_i1.p1  ORF type:complete len:252 (+),score=96.89 TRINITY_DN24235_c0_g1_i1:52-756(+)